MDMRIATIRPADAASAPLIGIGAACITVVIWAGWIIATRFAGETALSPITIGLFRYGPPAVLLAPVWWRCGLLPRQCPWWTIAIMVGGSGAPFFLLAAWAMRSAPAAQVGALLPGTMPLWAALIGYFIVGDRFRGSQRLGYLAIAVGTMLMVGLAARNDSSAYPLGGQAPSLQGQGLLLLAAGCWAAYSHAFKRSGLTPLQGSAITAAWSLLLHLLLAGLFGFGLRGLGLEIITLQLVVQGLLSGLIAIFSYGVAVRNLGAAKASAFSALAPVLAALGGAGLLKEYPGFGDSCAIALITLGVVLASGLGPSPARKPAA